ncbi:hypothetical protein BWD09_07165 [Neisseria dentiae]|uniref:Uncharacterized protein n=1 Tax=Neisseria dentiae TaxID=194197 RepID=A0A1X3D9Z7_9NEIS|nr:hypothetical protein [Neisseria dentiae]OSI16534.1 hypothetical protein BWD09_07165 [Neisseria dentiae]QMT44258.1 hypothetical protein H3L92_07115 [Neisseria dentiae]STZ49893.1 Uncharacterised protein [Neisseria dentiae]STZ49937.1 Uncharacterised protein [Neisseria dentiae]
MKKQPKTITMKEIGENLNLADLEWRAANYEKHRQLKDGTIELCKDALQLSATARRTMKRAQFYAGAATALILSMLLIVIAQAAA